MILGWLLDLTRDDIDLRMVHELARPDDGAPTLLAVNNPRRGRRDTRWGVVVNTTVEPDET